VKIRDNRRYESTGEMKLIRSKELKYTEIRDSEQKTLRQKEIASPKSAMRESFDRELSELKGDVSTI